MTTLPPGSVERRRRDRRRAGGAASGEHAPSWFGALGVDDAAALGPETLIGGPRGDVWAAAERPGADARFMARRLADGGRRTAFVRLYRTFVAARAAVGVMLLLVQAVVGIAGVPTPLPLVLVCVAYAAQALTLWLLPRFGVGPDARAGIARLTRGQWAATIGVDILAFSVLHALERSSSLNYDALLVLPVLAAGVLTPRLHALATAAAVALVLLATAWWSVVVGGDATRLLTQAGLAGGGFFVVTLLAGELAGRLAREEMAARGSLELARQQAQLNRLVIEEMGDGVFVVDRRWRVRTANPAARQLLGGAMPAPAAPFGLDDVEGWRPLREAVERAFDEGRWPESGREIALELAPGLRRTLRMRVRYTRRREDAAGEDLVVVFVEDVATMQARLRQEKLAAMGRVSAGIAHEIRNPLAAIAQANALLAEDGLEGGQARLAQIVADNVERLKRIVDDVLEVAPAGRPDAGAIDVAAALGAVAAEWAAANGLKLGEQCPLQVELPAAPLGAVFDAEHLRRVLVNLLDNALRHGSGAPGAVRVALAPRDAGAALLVVASDGPPIEPEVERHLFEPFFSTRSRGTGLGLYICRELCERYGGRIEYRQRPAAVPHRNVFVIVMRRAALPAADTRLDLAP